MERIVHGKFDDPESTRDIVGITPAEYEVIIEALRLYHKSLMQLLSTDADQRRELFIFSCNENLFAFDRLQTAEDTEASFKKREEQLIGHYSSSYEILAQLNKPYPGATYY